MKNKVLCLIPSHPQFCSWKQLLLTFLAVSFESFFGVSKVIVMAFDSGSLYFVPSVFSILISCCQEEGYPKASRHQAASLPRMLWWVDVCFQ